MLRDLISADVVDFVVVEQQWANTYSRRGKDQEEAGEEGKKGSVALFDQGECYGLIQGIIFGLGLEYKLILISPQAWKKSLIGDSKGKGAVIEAVKLRFPGIDLRRTPRCTTDHDGMADAVGIALSQWKNFPEGS